MIPSDVAVQQPLARPMMRRKSSAQNLLSNFKSNSNTSSVPGPSLSQGYVTIPPRADVGASGVPTPTTATMPRDWDSQSLQSESMMSATSTLNQNGTPVTPQGTSVEYLRDLVTKRMITLTYMRNVHEGCELHFFLPQTLICAF